MAVGPVVAGRRQDRDVVADPPQTQTVYCQRPALHSEPLGVEAELSAQPSDFRPGEAVGALTCTVVFEAAHQRLEFVPVLVTGDHFPRAVPAKVMVGIIDPAAVNELGAALLKGRQAA